MGTGISSPFHLHHGGGTDSQTHPVAGPQPDEFLYRVLRIAGVEAMGSLVGQP